MQAQYEQCHVSTCTQGGARARWSLLRCCCLLSAAVSPPWHLHPRGATVQQLQPFCCGAGGWEKGKGEEEVTRNAAAGRKKRKSILVALICTRRRPIDSLPLALSLESAADGRSAVCARCPTGHSDLSCSSSQELEFNGRSRFSPRCLFEDFRRGLAAPNRNGGSARWHAVHYNRTRASHGTHT